MQGLGLRNTYRNILYPRTKWTYRLYWRANRFGSLIQDLAHSAYCSLLQQYTISVAGEHGRIVIILGKTKEPRSKFTFAPLGL